MIETTSLARRGRPYWVSSIWFYTALVTASLATAGQYNDVLNIGDPAPSWSKLPGVDGRDHSLADLADKQVVVVVFTCNSCPIAIDYEDRIIAIAKEFAGPDGKAALVAINVNRIKEDSLERMKERAEKKGFPFPYLYDESQQIARAYGANFTPEFFVLDRDRKIVYMGGMDDNSNPDMVTVTYLKPAIEATLAGNKPATTETVARGCRVRYARERRP
ncbi:MAG: thioredoxin family protein [Pirellulales bacterium]|nr:thioredoxin family protein [Pirellulales bacterium]